MVAIIFSKNIISSRSQNHCRLKQSFDSVSLLYTLSESSFFYLTFFSISGHSRYFYTFVICSNSSRCVTSSWCCVIVNNCSLAHKRTPQAPSTKMRPPCTSCLPNFGFGRLLLSLYEKTLENIRGRLFDEVKSLQDVINTCLYTQY